MLVMWVLRSREVKGADASSQKSGARALRQDRLRCEVGRPVMWVMRSQDVVADYASCALPP